MQTQHQQALLFVLPVAITGSLLLPGAGEQAFLILSLIVLLGLPHGALDLEVLRRGPRDGRLASTLAYAGLAAGALLAFALAPRLTLCALLALSALHFGLEDGSGGPSRGGRRAEIVVRGSLPLVAPALAHPQAAALLLGAVEGLPPGTPSPLGQALGRAGLALVPAAVLLALVEAGRALRERRVAPLRSAAEIALLLTLFLVLSPLASFLVYFCAVHAVRHTLDLRLPGPARSWHEAGRRFVLGLPLSLGVVVAGAATWLALPGPPLESGVRIVFQALLALTLPHVWLHSRSAGRDTP